MAVVKQRLAAILAADVAGYSRLMADDETATITALDQARAVFRSEIADHGGRVVDTAGDSVLAIFETVAGAVEAARTVQAALIDLNAEVGDDRKMLFRIGVHLGDIHEKADGTIYGDGVNVAARLEGLAEPGGLTVSDLVQGTLRGRTEARFDFIGEHQVKNIPEPVRVYRVLDADAKVASTRAFPVPVLATAAAVVLISLGVVIWAIIEHAGAPPTLEMVAPEDPILELPKGPSIAVLPFTNMSGDPEQGYFSDGITEEIITALTRSPDLIVTARNTSFQYKGQAVDIKEVGRDLGVKYILEGSVRKAAETIRVTAQLLDAEDGTHLWAETYDRDLSAANIFAVQDEITQQVVGMIAGSYGMISRAGLEQTKRKRTDELEAYDCVLRLYAYRSVLGEDGHLEMRDCLERAVETDPEYADAWAWLSWVYSLEYMSGYNPRPDPLERAIAASRRAVDIEPMSGVARLSHARAYFFLREFDRFVAEAEKAIALSPNNSDVLTTIGYYFAFADEWERGLALIRKAMDLSPTYPGWAHEPFFWNYFRKGDYEAALAEARLTAEMMPKARGGYEFAIAAYGQLGRGEEARAMIAKLLELKPDYAKSAGWNWLKFNILEEVVDRYRDGLRKAGLEIPDEPAPID